MPDHRARRFDPIMPAPPPSALDSAFDPEAFRSAGHALVDFLADGLRASLSGTGKVITLDDPEAAFAEWQSLLEQSLAGAASPSAARDELGTFRKWADKAIKTHHPRNLGHQVGMSAPIAALADLSSSLLDTGNGVFEVGNPATAIERVVIRHLAKTLGFGDGAGGFLTSGGTLGNLTALLAARAAASPHDVWSDGNSDACALGVLVSDAAHYCIDRAARVMGWGTRGVVRVATDNQFRMRASTMAKALADARSAGVRVIAAVGNACTTATGAFDPLDELGAFCREHQLWFHVDAAHGGAAAFSAEHRRLLHGISQADSVVVDFHKLMLTPSLATAVLFRHEATSFATFTQQADYLWRADGQDNGQNNGQKAGQREGAEDSLPWFDAARRTMECTRPMAALRIFALLAAHGEQVIGETVDRVFATAKELASMAAETPGFEVLGTPAANIVCYRLAPPSLPPEACDTLNSAARARLVARGDFYIVETRIGGRTWLRSAIMNPFTTTDDLSALLRELQEAAAALRAGGNTANQGNG